jgi:hypothetical protein
LRFLEKIFCFSGLLVHTGAILIYVNAWPCCSTFRNFFNTVYILLAFRSSGRKFAWLVSGKCETKDIKITPDFLILHS